VLGELDRNDEAIRLYDDVISRFGAASELSLRKLVVSALVNKAAKFGQLDRSEEAITIFDEVATRFGAEAPFDELVQTALDNKDVALDHFGPGPMPTSC
jgi:hypothetical protein